MRLVVCEDHVMFSDALTEMLTQAGHEVVEVVSDGPQAIFAVLQHRPDVCLLDAHLPSGNGLLIIPVLVTASPKTRVVVLDQSADGRADVDARRFGASAFLGRDQPLEALRDVLTDVVSRPSHPVPRQWWGPEHESTRRQETDELRFLTGRERQVLEALVRGVSTGEIATELGVEVSTARTHIQNVLVKMGVHSRLEAAAMVTRGHLLAGRASPV